ncbi:MAG: hypothetical protein U1F68_21450 [Gammaproteobacteria bacterium]
MPPPEAAPARKPWHPYAVLALALLAPGSGHWAVGQLQRGVAFVWFMFILGWIGWNLTTPAHGLVLRYSGWWLIYGMSILDAYRIARLHWALARRSAVNLPPAGGR